MVNQSIKKYEGMCRCSICGAARSAETEHQCNGLTYEHLLAEVQASRADARRMRSYIVELESERETLRLELCELERQNETLHLDLATARRWSNAWKDAAWWYRYKYINSEAGEEWLESQLNGVRQSRARLVRFIRATKLARHVFEALEYMRGA